MIFAKWIILILISLGLFLLCGCNTTSSPHPIAAKLSQPSTSVKTNREDGLLALRQKLDLVQAKRHDAKEDKYYASPCCDDLSVLIGLQKSEIQKALGEPGLCKNTSLAGCKESDDLYYSFYYIPFDWEGGGPELWLQFDNLGKCKSANWVMTQ